MSLHLEDDQWCYVCGKANPEGFKLRFEHPKRGLLKAVMAFEKRHQGFKGIVHGGMVAMLLDEMMVNLAWLEGAPAVTAELKVRLKKPVRVGERVLLEGKVERATPRALYASASAKNAQGELLATAEATCLKIKSR